MPELTHDANDGVVRLDRRDGLATLVFDRPGARNAMTWAMYEQLDQFCRQLGGDSTIRAVAFRGAGTEAFVAGTDIGQFASFESGQDGIAYERRIDQIIGAIEQLPVPTMAVVRGWAVGGGLAIAMACDFTIASRGSRFGVPIARTLGNTLSIRNLARLQALFGARRARRMMYLADIVDGDEAAACGFLHRLCDADELHAAALELYERLSSMASSTQRAAKGGFGRLALMDLPHDDDLIRDCYESADFREGVSAFISKRPPRWPGLTSQDDA